jgi:hypothetical protein
MMKDGVIDEENKDYKAFHRQHVTKWGGLSQLIQ